MIIVMKPSATEAQVNHVKQMVRDLGLKDHPIVGTELTVVAVIGEDRKKDVGAFEQAPGVEKVMRVLDPYKLASREARPDRSTVIVGDRVVFGGKAIPVMAGPCSVEDEAHIVASAQAVKEAGAHVLRGGAFKPRTNPYDFQGHGEDGLKMLAAARAVTGLPIVTEVLTPHDVGMVSEYADCLQIGARNAQNFELLKEVGQQSKPVLYKRGMAMTLKEYLQAAEYILASGNDRVILCERGIRTFEDHTRNTLSLSAVPELQERSHLPVLIDPSHGTGHARMVPAMARAAVAAGCDALMIETHPDPEHAMTDGAQSVTPKVLAEIIDQVRRVAAAVDRSIHEAI